MSQNCFASSRTVTVSIFVLRAFDARPSTGSTFRMTVLRQKSSHFARPCRDFLRGPVEAGHWVDASLSGSGFKSRLALWTPQGIPLGFRCRFIEEITNPQGVVFSPASVSTDVKHRDAQGRLANRGTCAGRAVLVTARRWNPARGDSRRDGNTISERWMTSGNRPERRVSQWQRPSSADGDAGSNPAAAIVGWLFRVGQGAQPRRQKDSERPPSHRTLVKSRQHNTRRIV